MKATFGIGVPVVAALCATCDGGALNVLAVHERPDGAQAAHLGTAASDWSAVCRQEFCSRNEVTEDANARGGRAVHIVTDAHFDFAAITPPDEALRLDVSRFGHFGLFLKARNSNDGGWQPPSTYQLPFFVLGGDAGTITYSPETTVLPVDGETWLRVDVPLAPAAGSGWKRDPVGTALSRLDWIEIHADTWGGGFDLWIDDLAFD